MLTIDFDRLGVRPDSLVLDAGCGFGRHSLEALKRHSRVISMDIDLDSLRRTRFSLSQLEPGQEYFRYMVHAGDAGMMPFNDNTFDTIVCSEVMEHVPDEELACRELVRILKPGGTIGITVPTPFSETLYYLLTHEYFSTPGGHVRIITPKRLNDIMTESGLSVYGIDFRHSFHTIWWAIRCVVGLHRENHPFTRSYHSFLSRGLFSPFMRRAETFFDWFFPKSLILYGRKPVL
jgi:ubiquinone/menaquinone biosynthesis C-methylase UbiE